MKNYDTQAKFYFQVREIMNAFQRPQSLGRIRSILNFPHPAESAIYFRVADSYHFNEDPDPAFNLNADLDPTFHFNANPDPAPHQSDVNQRPLVY